MHIVMKDLASSLDSIAAPPRPQETAEEMISAKQARLRDARRRPAVKFRR